MIVIQIFSADGILLVEETINPRVGEWQKSYTQPPMTDDEFGVGELLLKVSPVIRERRSDLRQVLEAAK